MNRSELSFGDIFKKGAVIFNPVLIQLVGLCPVVAASTSFLSAAMLSAVLCIELILTCVLASALFKSVPRWIRVALYLITGLAVACPILYFVDNYTLADLSLGMQIYIPLMAVNSVTAVHCEQFAVKNSVKLAFFDAAAVGIGVSVIFLVVGAVREILGNASFAGMPINLPITFKGMTLPFGCLILLGFLAAILKALSAKFGLFEEDEEETESETVAESGPVEVDLDLGNIPAADAPMSSELGSEKEVYDEFNAFLKTLDLENYISREGESE